MSYIRHIHNPEIERERESQVKRKREKRERQEREEYNRSTQLQEMVSF